MIRRARPLLGTVVTIGTDGPMAAVDAAFAVAERVHLLMSAQRAESDIGRINRQADHAPVAVDPWTFSVLERALQISAQTAGTFDIVVPGSGARYTDLVLQNGRVSLRRPARIDVSGIAKGFAVDAAVEALQAAGAPAGCVNAGGDLRLFGDWPDAVHVRSPADLATAVRLPATAQRAFATSSGYYGSRLDDPRTGQTVKLAWSVTVAASTCLVADALTKAVALLGPVRALLDAFRATAFAVDADGKLHAAAG